MADHSGRRIVEMVWEDLKPRDICSRRTPSTMRSRVLMALGGSTNAIVHLIAMAGRAGIALDLERSTRSRASTPLLANMRPSGKYLMEDFYYAGGLRALLAWHAASMLDLNCHDGERQDAGREHRRRRRSTTTTSSARSPIRCKPPADSRCCAAISRPTVRSSSRLPPTRSCSSTPGRPWCSTTTTTWQRASTIRRSGRRCRFGVGAAQRRPARRPRHAGVGHAADPEEAAEARRARHGAHFRCAHERHQLRRLRAACCAGILRRRAAGAGRRPAT